LTVLTSSKAVGSKKPPVRISPELGRVEAELLVAALVLGQHERAGAGLLAPEPVLGARLCGKLLDRRWGRCFRRDVLDRRRRRDLQQRGVDEHGVGLAGLDAGADDVCEREHGDHAGEATGEATAAEEL
jgi:hypothetical protein